MLRANVPAIYIYGGTILPGRSTLQGRDLNIVSVFGAVGQFTAGKMSEEDFCQIERHAIPAAAPAAACTPPTPMSSAFEALGLSLPYASTMANVEGEIVAMVEQAAKVLVEAVKADLAARHRHEKAIENAVAVIAGHRRLDQRGAALPRSTPCGASSGPSTTSSASASARRCCAT